MVLAYWHAWTIQDISLRGYLQTHWTDRHLGTGQCQPQREGNSNLLDRVLHAAPGSTSPAAVVRENMSVSVVVAIPIPYPDQDIVLPIMLMASQREAVPKIILADC